MIFSVLSCSLIDSSAPEIEFQWWNQGVPLKGMLRKKIQDSLVIQGRIQASIEVRKLYYNSIAKLGDPSPCSIKALVLKTRL